MDGRSTTWLAFLVFQDVVSKELLNDFQKSKAIPEELGQEEKSTTAWYDHFLTLTILRNRDTTAVRARIELQGCCSKRTFVRRRLEEHGLSARTLAHCLLLTREHRVTRH
jgi:hypothetical protein